MYYLVSALTVRLERVHNRRREMSGNPFFSNLYFVLYGFNPSTTFFLAFYFNLTVASINNLLLQHILAFADALFDRLLKTFETKQVTTEILSKGFS